VRQRSLRAMARALRRSAARFRARRSPRIPLSDEDSSSCARDAVSCPHGTAREIPFAMPTANGISNGTTAGTIKSTASDLADEAKTFAADARSFAADTAKSARAKLDAAREHVEESAYEAIETTERFAAKAKKRAVSAGDSVAAFVQDRPLVALGAAFAAGGLLIGLLVRR
jgi:ElaB/YqjD/DUF883 family membrane-anchored ribosome-binding protein